MAALAKIGLNLLPLLLLASVAIVGAQEAPAPAPVPESGSSAAAPDLYILALTAMTSLLAAFAH